MRLNYIGRRTAIAMVVIVLAAVVLAFRPAWALTGGDLKMLCSNDKKGEYCAGYIAAMVDSAAPGCLPPKDQMGKSVRVITDFLLFNPWRLNEKASDLIREAFSDEFSCKKN